MNAVRFDLKWAYWCATALFLTLGLVAWPPGVAAAIGLTFAQLLHFAWRERSLATLTVQVRALFLAAFVAGLWPPLAVVHAIQAVGVWANVLFGYCAAARLLSLMPWNRRAPLSPELVARTFLAPPRAGSILDAVALAPDASGRAPAGFPGRAARAAHRPAGGTGPASQERAS